MSKNVFVVIEQLDNKVQRIGYELLGEATSLAEDLQQSVVAVLIGGTDIAKSAEELIHFGADEVIVVAGDRLTHFASLPYTRILEQVIRENDPEIVLFGASSIGRDLAPRTSARIKTGLTADCTGLSINPENKLLMMTRPAFGGNLMAVINCKTRRPQMATVRPGVMQPIERDASRTGKITNFVPTFQPSDFAVEILDVIPDEDKKTDITQAKFLVSGGRGVGSAEGFQALRDLADTIGGDVAGSRAAVEAGWIGPEYQVGQTGKTVRPNLYIACGISGAIQHMAGMENSENIIAINTNPNAPIFNLADLGVVGDLHAILPKLNEAITKAKELGEAYVPPVSSDSFMNLSNVTFNIEHGMGYLTINRPHAMNALNVATLGEIESVADYMKTRDDIKVLIVRGAGGRAFAAGADIAAMHEMTEEEARDISDLAQRAFSKLKALPQIVIAAINGYTLGGGNELAMACDIRIASSRSKFGQPEVNLGLIPGFTGSQRLPRLVGQGNAKLMIFTAERISAEEALRIGLVNKVVAPEALMRTVQAVAMQILSKSVYAVQQAKKAINEGCAISIEDGLKIENAAWVNCFSEEGEGHEGMTAFVEKRKPKFRDF